MKNLNSFFYFFCQFVQFYVFFIFMEIYVCGGFRKQLIIDYGYDEMWREQSQRSVL